MEEDFGIFFIDKQKKMLQYKYKMIDKGVKGIS